MTIDAHGIWFLLMFFTKKPWLDNPTLNVDDYLAPETDSHFATEYGWLED